MKNFEIKIGRKTVGDHNQVFIIAEAGVNHNGDMKLARKLVDTAKEIGADAIKFQTFCTEEMVSVHAPKARYQHIRDGQESQFDMLKKLELSQNEFRELLDYCKKKKIVFLSTPFDLKSAAFLRTLNLSAYKISSGELTNLPLVAKVAQYHKPIILSTGMASIDEIKEAVKIIGAQGNKQLIVLHCTSSYPAPFDQVNLKAIPTLQEKFHCCVGYSDHTPGIEVAVAAVALGACVIEKHLTLDKNMPGPDHQVSLNPIEFKLMIEAIRHVELAKGDGIKQPTPNELEIKRIARKSIVAAYDIPKGIKLNLDMLTVKRPGTGIEPKWLARLKGRQTKKNILKDELLSWDSIQ